MIHAITRQATKITIALGLSMGVLMASIPAAEARGGFSGGRSGGSSFSSRSSSSYRSAPSSTPKVVKTQNVRNVTVNRTTVVHQSVNSAPSASSGIMSSMIGSFAGTSLANWWFNSDDDKKDTNEQPAEAVQTPAQVPATAQ
ncbi:hypothetical protein 10P302A_gene0006 [Pseudomonas phage 10P302A]|uniref:Uncharacterized protein n=1 Tax=Pseudomonas phage 10P302A TaxID=3038233 RepID=A0AAF0GNP0_9CAUD|nr:hypothetical protein 10P302A_gene0006 [Pseudomonas phage 10P302A]